MQLTKLKVHKHQTLAEPDSKTTKVWKFSLDHVVASPHFFRLTEILVALASKLPALEGIESGTRLPIAVLCVF